MNMYHVIMGANDTQSLQMFKDDSLNILMSASMLTFDKRWKNNINFIQKKSKSLYADSGMIGWVKNLRGEDAWNYAVNPKLVLDIQLRINPDIVATLDIPSEPFVRKKLGKTLRETMDRTIKNAEWLIQQKNADGMAGIIPKNPRLAGKKIAIGIQGWHIHEYIQCVEEFKDRGFLNLDPKDFMFAIGSVCMRRPPGLYEIAKVVRDMIPEKYELHCYGIANVSWVLYLDNIGITSCDSATASYAGAMFRWIDELGKQVPILLPHKDSIMKHSMIAFNIASINHQLETRYVPAIDDLYFDNEAQCEMDYSLYAMEEG